MKTCPSCEEGILERVEDIIFETEGYIFVAQGKRCAKCKEEFPDSAETQRFVTTARKLGVWPEPLKLRRHLSRSSGGLLFRIPSDLEKQLNLDEHKEIEISKVGNKIIIEPR